MSGPRVLGRVIAVFIIFYFVMVTPSLILAYNAQQAVLKGSFLDDVLQEPDLFAVVIRETARNLPRDLERDPTTRDMPIARLSTRGWEQVLTVVAPPARMQQWAQDAVAAFRNWSHVGGRFLADVIVPFGEMRDNLVNDPNQTVLRAVTEAQPECTASQDPLGGAPNLVPRCRPSAAGLEAFYRQLAPKWREQPRELWQQLWPAEFGRYPDDISVVDLAEKRTGDTWWETNFGWSTGRWALRLTDWLFIGVIALHGLIALGLVALFAARDGKEVFRWVGVPVILAGAFTLLLALIIRIGWEVGTLFIPSEEFIGTLELADRITRAFASAVWLPTAVSGGVLLAVGLVLWGLSFAIPSRHDRASVATPPTRGG